MTTYMNCTFTAADGTSLSGFTPDTGAAFVLLDGSPLVTSNRGRPGDGARGYWRSGDTYPSADYTVQVTARRLSLISGEKVFVGGHCTQSFGDYPLTYGNSVSIRYDGTNLQIVQRVSGTDTQLGSNTAWSPSNNTDYVLKLVFSSSGTKVDAYLDGVAICGGQQTTTLTTTGYSALGAEYGSAASSSTGWTFDNWSVASNGGGGGGSNAIPLIKAAQRRRYF